MNQYNETNTLLVSYNSYNVYCYYISFMQLLHSVDGQAFNYSILTFTL